MDRRIANLANSKCDAGGTQSNDENMLVIEDAALAAAHAAEFARRWDEASTPRDLVCG